MIKPPHTVTAENGVRFAESVTDLIGGTPLVRLRRITGDVHPLVLAKLEYLNPGGSVKDRIALRMIEAAEASGRLLPGGTLVEPTSGNTGVGLAMAAHARGYHCIFTCPDKVSAERIDVLRALGAEVIICPAAVLPDDPRSYRSVSDRLAAEIPGGCKLDQYANPDNARAHYEGTGPEIWQQTAGRVTHFVAAIGTGGTISGAGRFLKEASDGTVRVVGADPDGSVYSGGSGRPYLLEGVGQPGLPAAYDPTVPDEVFAVTDRESLMMTRRLAREEGLLVGGSSGMAVAAALRAAADLEQDSIVVVLLPDSGRGYVSKIFNDRWMARLGMLDHDEQSPCVADVLAGRPHTAVSCVAPDAPVSEVAAAMRHSRLTHLPVARARPPVRLAEIIGTVTERDLELFLQREGKGTRSSVEAVMTVPLPHVGIGESLSDLRMTLETTGAALVLDGGCLAGVVALPDLLDFLADRGD